jgi:hypothetical protein
MRKSLLIYAVPLTLVVVSPFLPDSGRDSRDVSFMANLGLNVLRIAGWLTVSIFVTRLVLLRSAGRDRSAGPDPLHRGFEVVARVPPESIVSASDDPSATPLTESTTPRK